MGYTTELMKEALSTWLDKDKVYVSGMDTLPFLLHHCILEIRFDRRFEDCVVSGYTFKKLKQSKLFSVNKSGRPVYTFIKRAYRDNRPRNAFGAPTVSPRWLGKPYRTMLCTLDMTLLKSDAGRISLGFREPSKWSSSSRIGNTITVWDILWQDWRCIPVDGNLEVLSLIPTSIFPGVLQGGNIGPYRRRIIEEQRKICWRLIGGNFSSMKPRQKIKYMDGEIDLGIQAQQKQLLDSLNKEIKENLKPKRRVVQKKIEPEQDELVEQEKQETFQSNGLHHQPQEQKEPEDDDDNTLSNTIRKAISNSNSNEPVQD